MDTSFLRDSLLAEMVAGGSPEATVPLRRDTFDLASAHGTDAERVFRQSMSDRMRMTQLGNVYGLEVWAVNGQRLRLVDPEFTYGGNGASHTYIPTNQIWIDEAAQLDELAPYIVHQIAMFKYMAAGLPSDQAHEKANAVAHRLRRVLVSLTVRPGVQKSLDLSNRYLERMSMLLPCCHGGRC